MAATYTLDALLRPPVELYTTAISYMAAALCVFAPWALALTPLFGLIAALMFAYLGTIRLLQALRCAAGAPPPNRRKAGSSHERQ